MIPTADGYVSAPGWAIKGNEITSATNGKIGALVAFPTSAENNYTVAVCGKRTLELVSGTWTNRQDANDFGMGDNDHADTAIAPNDTLLIAVPKSGAANVLRTWTGTGNIAAMTGSPLNARWIEWWGERMMTAGAWTGTTYLPTRVYRSAQNSITSHPGDYTDMIASPSPIMKILRLGQMLVVYKQTSLAILHITGDAVEPFEVDEVPGNVGLALPEAVAAGGRYHCYLSPDNFYLFDGLSAPTPIGGDIAALVYDKLGTGSFLLAGYDVRSPQREAFWFLSNVALLADDVAPNSVASTNTYWVFDVTTKSWARGDLGANVPRAFGNFYNRFGFLKDSPISQLAALIALESTNGTSAYEMDYATVNRVGASFTRRLLTTMFHMGDPFLYKTVYEAVIVFKRQASGTVTLSWKTADGIGEKPSERVSVGFSMTGAVSGANRITPIAINASGRIHQVEITTTGLSEIDMVLFKWGVKN